MKAISLTFIFLFLFFTAQCQSKKPVSFFAFGIDYRQQPIDIEDVPRGPSLRSDFGEMTGPDFWKVISLHGKLGIIIKNNWLLSVAAYSRYNHNHFLEDPLTPSAPTVYSFNNDTKDKEKIKFDVFIDTEKKFRLKRNKEKYLTVLAGLGFTNINSGTDIYYRRNLPSGAASDPVRYKGSYFHFGPRFSIGYQYKKIKGSVDAYIIEDELQTNLTALWLGATLSYEIIVKKKKSK